MTARARTPRHAPGSGGKARRALVGTGLVLMLLAGAPSRMHAADAAAAPADRSLPARIRLLVAYPPGGLSSEVARALADEASRLLGRPVLVEHRPGAGGTLAMEVLARAAADGSVLVFSAITPLTLAPVQKALRYDPARDIAPLLAVMSTPVLVLGTPALQARDWTQMLEQARHGHVRWATSGLGTTGHLVLERVARAAALQVTHVPYKGGGQQISDALGGQFELLSSNAAPLQIDLVREGRLAALAVTGDARLAALPAVPTLTELGQADANVVSTFGIFAPGRTPPPLQARLNQVFDDALQASTLRQRLQEAGSTVLGGSAAAFAQRIADERERHRAGLGEAR